MSRWQRPKKRKSDKDIKRGQQFMFPLHDDPAAPWETDYQDATEAPLMRDIPPAPQRRDVEPPPQDDLPF